MDPALLQPSLKDRPAVAGFSQQAAFFVGFFGGGIASLLFTACNLSLWRRWRKDLPLFAVAAVVVTAVVFFHVYTLVGMRQAGEAAPWWLTRGVPRALGIAAWGVFALRHRPMFAAQELSDLKPRNAWLPGIACILVALGISLLLGALAGAVAV